MSKKLFHRNSVTGITYFMHDTEDDEQKIVETVYDRQPVLDHAAYMRNEVHQRKDGAVKIGSIPMTLYFQWLREGKLGELDENGQAYVIEPEKIRALLNSPEYKLLKTIDGQA